jgi:hypothetical protein
VTAARARSTLVPLVHTNKEMMLKLCQYRCPFCPPC